MVDSLNQTGLSFLNSLGLLAESSPIVMSIRVWSFPPDERVASPDHIPPRSFRPESRPESLINN